MNETRDAAVETREVRFADGLELRAAREGSNSPGTLDGYAAVFGKLSEDLGGFREQIAPGAFARALQSADVIAVLNHDDDYLLGRSTSGTLRLKEDDRGLRSEIDLPDTMCGRDCAISVGRGDLRGMSFAFIARQEQWDFNASPPLRTLLEVDLFDVSVVTRAAYPDTSVALRSLEAARTKATVEQPSPPEPQPDTESTDQLRLRLCLLEAEYS